MNDTTITEALTDILPTWADPPGLGRSMVIGSIIGVVLSFIGVTVGILTMGIEWQSALGLGLFVAFWGGLGFGSMVGGVIYAFGIETSEHHVEAEGSGAVPSARSESVGSQVRTSSSDVRHDGAGVAIS